MDKRKLKKVIIYVFAILLFFMIISVVFSFHAIYTGVKNICIRAKGDFGEDCITSLVLFVRSDNYSEKDKIHAIWALGQIADSTAIQYLEEFQKKYDCADRSKKSKICYELYKALKWCTRGNVTSWMYKNREKW
jgi:hypothetical protein